MFLPAAACKRSLYCKLKRTQASTYIHFELPHGISNSGHVTVLMATGVNC